MSAKPKPQSSELDHIRDTLTDLVGSVGEGNSDTRQLKQQFNQFKHEVYERLDKIEQEQATREDIAGLELLIRQLLPNANS